MREIRENSNAQGNIVISTSDTRTRFVTYLLLIFATMFFMLVGVVWFLLAHLNDVSSGSSRDAVSDIVQSKAKVTIDLSCVNQKLVDMGELTTAELTYDGLLRYDQGSIPLLTKHGFLMSYSSQVRAGIDFSKVKLRVKGDRVIVSMPRAKVQLLYVDPESISIYDEDHALFEGDGKDHLKTALIKAEEDAQEHLDIDALLDRADQNAEDMIYNLLCEVVGEAEIEFSVR